MKKDILQLRSGFPLPPSHLKRAGKAFWESGKDLWNEGILTNRDLSAWAMFSESFDEIAHCDAITKEHGEYSESSQGGFTEHPALRRRRAAESKIMRFQKVFGIVPEARKKRPSVSQGVATRKTS